MKMSARDPNVRDSRLQKLLAGVVTAVLPVTLVAALPQVAAADTGPEPFELVDLFIGTELDTSQNKSNDAYGNAYPGAAVPFGMVQSSPTTYKVGETNDLVREKGGYEYTADQLRGFGLTRYQGSGCHLRFGGYEVPTIPYAGEFNDGLLPVLPSADIGHYYLDFDHANEVAEPGFYSVITDNLVSTELTATERTAVSRFDFTEADGSTLLVNVSGQNNRSQGQSVTIDPETNTVSGWMRGADMCDNGNYYTLYFSTTYDQDFESFGVWNDGVMTAGEVTATLDSEGTGADFRNRTGAWLTFEDGASVTARTGISYVSVANAELNREAEAEGKSFDEVRANARASWEEALGTIEITGGSRDDQVKFYSALYRSFLHPNIRNDVNGQYLGYDNEVHEVEDGRNFYKNFAGSGWDMYRSHAQLLALTHPVVAADINQSIVLLTEQTGGWAPGAARMQGDSLQTIISTTDDMGITNYDREAALQSMIDTQQLPGDKSTRTDAYQYFATGMIENRKGDFATSRVLEYSINDFSIAHLAGELGNEEAYDFFMGRAQNWMNVFDFETQHIRPRERGGFDRGFDLRGRDGSGGGQFNQSTGYQYGWLVPHNLGTLIELRGGVEKSTNELDVLMEDLDAGAYTQTGNYLSNQPAWSTPWVYNWLQAPHETTDVLYRAVNEMYDTSPAGLPGNDDQGSLSSWYLFATMGMYPAIYGTGDMIVSAPMFEKIVINPADSDRVITINASGAGPDAKYTTGLSVNGVAQTESWIDASFLHEGGTLDFEMSAVPGTWGTGVDDVPPSYTDGMNAMNNAATTHVGAGNMGSADLSNWSYSVESLAAAGVTPGGDVPYGDDTDLVFTFPDTEPGEPDNWIPHGQRIDFDGETAGAISFLGMATNGPSQGTATVLYTDGSTQSVPVYMTDWASNPAGGNKTIVETSGRNNQNGSGGSGTFRLFGTRPALLDSSKQLEAVYLPTSTDRGIMHIFDVAIQEEEWVDPNAPLGEPERIVLNPSDDPSTSQYVTWRSTAQRLLTGQVEYRVVGGESVVVDADNKAARTHDGYPSRSHSALLENLSPNTKYEYRVGGEGRWSDWHTFTTASDEIEPFTFLYFGDAQNGLSTVWPESVRVAQENFPDAQLALTAGDLVDNASNDGQWTEWFDGIAPLRTSMNILSVPGNHEIGGQHMMENYFDSFEYAPNGPVASDAREYADEFGEHYAQILQDTVYYTDYQGVRFIGMNANRDDICTITQVEGSTADCETRKRAWNTTQATWLDRVLDENPHQWTVVQFHQPIFSTGISGEGLRDQADWRQHILPVLERHNVDLVLQGHDHTYGRGYHSSTGTGYDGVSAGPVYVVSNAGEKMYGLPSATDNIWTRNNATMVVSEQDTATVQGIRVDGNTLTYESVASYTRSGGNATVQAGQTLDSFTITKDGEAKWVTEAGVDVPEGAEPVNTEKSMPFPFDDETFGNVVWDDTFDVNRLPDYTIFGGGAESSAEITVNTDDGLLQAYAPGRRWSHLALPVAAGNEFALIVEPSAMAESTGDEDTIFIGLTNGERSRAHSWYNHAKDLSGMDVVDQGQTRGLSAGTGDLAVTWEPGDRLATVYSYGELSSWIEKDGQWQLIRWGGLDLTLDRSELAQWSPTFSLRLDAGNMAIDRVTLLQPGGELIPALIAPAEVTADSMAGILTIPNATGVNYAVDGEPVEAGEYEFHGTVTVTAEPAEGYAFTDEATTQWSFTYLDPDNPIVVEPGEPTTTNTYTIPDIEGLEYLVDGVVTPPGTYPFEGTIVITVRALPGYTLEEGTQTEWVLTAEPTEKLIEVTPEDVTWTDTSYTIPDTDGVDYLLSDIVTTAGTYFGTGDITIRARAQDGYTLTEGSTTEWSFTLVDDTEEPGEPGDEDPEEPGEPEQPITGNVFLLSNDWTSTTAALEFAYGKRGDQVFVGDWDGDGKDTLGVRRGNTFYLTNKLTGGIADNEFNYGRTGDEVLVGDWDGDGSDTLGVRRGNTFYLNNELTGGIADLEFDYGRNADEVLIGDWDGNGTDTITVRRGHTYHVTNELRGGHADTSFAYGKNDDRVYAGDFTGNDHDTLAIRRGNAFLIRNELAGGPADIELRYGKATDHVIIGDWDGDGIDTPGVNRVR